MKGREGEEGGGWVGEEMGWDGMGRDRTGQLQEDRWKDPVPATPCLLTYLLTCSIQIKI